MQVKTNMGFTANSNIRSGAMVWSKDPNTGTVGYKMVMKTIHSVDPDTTTILVKDKQGRIQTIISDARHPYFAEYGSDTSPPNHSLGKEYNGNLPNAYWIDASKLKPGYRLVSDDGSWQTVIDVKVERKALNSYNLEVQNYHTFFIKGKDGSNAVWVHNTDCWVSVPTQNIAKEHVGGYEITTFNDNGRTVQVMKNPAYPATSKAAYIEVDVYGSGEHAVVKTAREGESDILREVGKRPKDVSTGQFISDPYVIVTDGKYNRPSLRKDVTEPLYAQYEFQNVGEHGQYKLKGTDIVIDGPFDIGHVPGWEHRRLDFAADQLGLTQAQFNDFVNAHPQNFRIENRSDNRNHKGEEPGAAGLDDRFTKLIIEDMKEFFNID